MIYGDAMKKAAGEWMDTYIRIDLRAMDLDRVTEQNIRLIIRRAYAAGRAIEHEETIKEISGA
jgi:hypothetical protein